MLLNNFFTIQSLTKEETAVQADITVNADHPIFQGHFPGQPVVPGVCMISMLQEVMQEATGNNLQLSDAPVIKFLTMFAPPHHTSASFSIQFDLKDEQSIRVNATLSAGQVVFLKFNGSFQIV